MITNEDGAYPNGIGHSGSETSEAAQDKVTGKRAIQVHEVVGKTYDYGMTCSEVQTRLAIGHGAASGALTRLHRSGFLSRLAEDRRGQQVYVHPEHVKSREESPYRPNVAYRDGYKKPMALEEILSDEQIADVVKFARDEGASTLVQLGLRVWLKRFRDARR